MRPTERDARENFLRALAVWKKEDPKTEETLIEVVKYIRYVELEARLYIENHLRGEDTIFHAQFF